MNAEVRLTANVPPTSAEPLCPACGGEIERFFELPELPVNSIALGATREAALGVPKGAIELGFCRGCGAISNLLFDPAKLTYDPNYDNSLHFSPSFQQYADEVARDLVARHDLHAKNVIDVGCGNGEFLSLVCGLGDNRGVGFDPAFIPGRADLKAGRGVTIIRDYYSESYAHYKADFVVCRHVLEHIATPHQFLHSMRATLRGNPGAAVFFELPDASFVFRNRGIWDVIYEHCFYYSSGALTRLVSACGFDVRMVSSTFHGQYLCLEAQVSAREAGLPVKAGGELEAMWEDIRRFSQEYRSSREYWEDLLSRFARDGKRVALWGAGAKGAMFLNTFGNIPSLEYIVDVNPHKWGLYIPGTGQKVVSPDFLTQYRPDVLLIANPNYREEISRHVATLGVAPALFSI